MYGTILIISFLFGGIVEEHPLPLPDASVAKSIILYPEQKIIYKDNVVKIVDVTEEEKKRSEEEKKEKKEVEERKIDIIMFGAPWCKPCQSMHPLLARLHYEDNIPIYYANIDLEKYKSLVEKYKVNSVPFFVLRVDNEVIKTHVGKMSEHTLREWFNYAQNIDKDNTEDVDSS